MRISNPPDEAARLETLASYGLLDTPPEPEFDHLTALAAKFFDAPIALVSLVDADRVWYKSSHGLSFSETPRALAFCASTILEAGPLVVPDAAADERFAASLLVAGLPHVRCYAGAPLTTREGVPLGAVCVMDTVSRTFSDTEMASLTQLAVTVMAAIEARRTERRLRQEIAVHEQTAQALRAVEARYQRTTENIPGMVYQFIRRADGSGEFPFVSDACRKILELEPAVLQRDANAYFDLVHPKDRAGRDRAVAEAIATMQPLCWEGRHRLPSGQTKWLQISSQPERMPNGDIFWDGLLTDVTERKRAENRLLMLGSSVENANDVILVTAAEPVDEPGPRIIYVNKAFTATTGYTAEEVIGKNPRILQGPGTSPEAKATIRRALKAWKPVQVELLNYRKDGSEFWVELNIVPVANEKGWYTHWVSVQREISERKEIEQTLKQSKKELEDSHHLLRAVVDGTDNIIYIRNREGRYVMINPAGATTLRHTPEEVIGKDDSAFLSLENARTIQAADQEVLRTDRPITYESSDTIAGVEHVFISTKSPYRDAGGNVLGVIGIAREITEQRKAAEALQQAKEEAESAREEAERANRAKSEFLSRMSHELRTPLNAILGFGQLLEMDAPTDRQREKLSHILKGGKHLLGLINEVLDISRIESGQMELTLEAVNVETVFNEAAALIQPLAAQRGIHVGRCLGRASQRALRADRQRLSQVVLNLLSNAVKYNRSGGTVSISCEPAAQADWLRLAVTDTGPGIAPSDLGKLFTPFERLAAEHSNIEGSGIGLALSKRLVEAMGGTIGAESTPGRGSTFHLELPAAVAASSANGSAAVIAPDPLPVKGPVILCIEDNLSNYSLVELALEATRPNIRLVGAMQGQLGLEMAREQRPDLILLDLQLPDIPGDELLQQLQTHASTREIPVIMITADATNGQSRRLLELGARAYLTKPLNISVFLQTIDEALAGQRMEARSLAGVTR